MFVADTDRAIFSHCLAGLVLAAAAAISGVAFAADAPGARPHVILISMDTTRADFLGCYGHPWCATPALDAFAAEAICFEDCMTAAPSTLAAHTTMMTGNHPHRHGVPRNRFVAHEDNRTLAEILKEDGYRTAAFIAGFPLHRRFGLMQGFDHYDDTLPEADHPDAEQCQRPANEITDAVLRYLDSDPADGPRFLFIHYFDPHLPYAPPPPFDTQFARNAEEEVRKRFNIRTSQTPPPVGGTEMVGRYAGEVAFMDREIGRLFAGLRDRGLLDKALTLVTSDHGESLLDNIPFFDHGANVYQSVMRIACMFRLPGGLRGGLRVAGPVSNTDFLPTILRQVGIGVPEGIDGGIIDLNAETIKPPKDAVFGQATKPSTVADAADPWPNRRKAAVIRQGGLVFIQTPYLGTCECYDLAQDPKERRNLALRPGMEIHFTGLKARLNAWVDSASPLPLRCEEEDAVETRKRLEALGYVD